ncbi:hypothetical protein BJF78_22540 [Pseudonocardia sp. CNS-139]|nr:hypothetical protein BJF78_22540 [Pseudonocardia sp. CNS-139]
MTTSRWTTVHPTLYGPLTISATDTGITNVTFRSRLSPSSPEDGARLQAARLLVPCHRVLGVNGKLTATPGGWGTKQALLEMEAGGRRPVQLAMTV